mgnify:CR=1 FL=1
MNTPDKQGNPVIKPFVSPAQQHQPLLGRMVRTAQVTSFLDAVYATAAAGRQWIVDKSPAAFVYKGRTVTDVIFECFPDAYVLCCYRDGKNFVYGHLNLPWPSKTGWNVEKATDFWIEQMQWLQAAPAHPRMKTVRYESLVEAPARSLEIAEFLGMTPHRDIQPWSTPRNTLHRTPDADRWKTLDADGLAVMKRMNPTLVAFGYEPV